MDYIPEARPLSRYPIINRGDRNLIINSGVFTLELDTNGNLKHLEGGMGIVYQCSYFTNPGVRKIAWAKHAKIDATSIERVEQLLPKHNEELENEIVVQKKAAELQYAPQIIAQDSSFSASRDDPKFCLFIQEDALGESFYNLKDSTDYTKRIEILSFLFRALIELHRNKIFHCDLDLNHIYWDNANRKITIIDWGGSLLGNLEPKQRSRVKGKMYFSPSEQMKDNQIFKPQSEVFNAGAVAYYFLTNRKNGEEAPNYRLPDYDGYDLLESESIPMCVKDTVFKATRSNHEERFNSMTEMLTAWRGEEENLALKSLFIKNHTAKLGIVNTENATFQNEDIAISCVQNGQESSWNVTGNFDVFMRSGPHSSHWKEYNGLKMINCSKILRMHSDGSYLMLEVKDGTSGSSGEVGESIDIYYQNLSTRDEYILVKEGRQHVELKSIFGETIQVIREELEENYQKLT